MLNKFIAKNYIIKLLQQSPENSDDYKKLLAGLSDRAMSQTLVAVFYQLIDQPFSQP
jgi:hypothetical protein